MKTAFRIEGQALVSCGAEQGCVLLYVEQTDSEKTELLRVYDIDPPDFDGIFDADEVPRIEFSDDKTLVIWKRPNNAALQGTVRFEVSSLGIVLTADKLVLIVPQGTLPLTGKEFKRVASVNDCLLRVLLYCVHHYQGHLKAIKQMSQELQAKLVTSMENQYLLQMFSLGESLVYYHNAIEANHAVLGKLRAAAERLKFSPQLLELLDDVMIENQQAGKQAGIYTSVLSGLMDARGTIINNNMNVLLKNLTIINVVFLPLNLIASIGGMSEYSAMTQGADWRVSYGLFFLAMVALGWITWWWLTRILERQYLAGSKRRRPGISIGTNDIPKVRCEN